MTAPFLLHMTTPGVWRAALGVGSVAPPSLLSDGFVHLSMPGQVAIPADALYAGRDDLLLLVVDPRRAGDPILFEEGVPPHPDGIQFPHLYGRLPCAAVTSVLPYRPGSDGHFGLSSCFRGSVGTSVS